MNDLNTFEIQPEKFYKERAIWVGAFLGGPLAAGYLISKNYEALHEPENAKKTWIFSIITTIVVIVIAILIPEDTKMPTNVIPLIYTALAYYLAQYFQGAKVKSQIENGGEYYGGGELSVSH